MPNKNRREALQSLASIFMFGSAAGTVAYIKREELAELLPEPRRHDWKPWVMVMTTVHPTGISRGQANAINSTKAKVACDLNGLGYTKVQLSDDLNSKCEQLREMKLRLEENGPYNIITVNKHGRVKLHKVPDSPDLMVRLIEGVN